MSRSFFSTEGIFFNDIFFRKENGKMKKEALKTAIVFLLIAIAVSVAVFVVYINLSPHEESLGAVNAEPFPTVVIDAGHGGRDGGAIGYDGTAEKELNLQIANVLAELLRVSGYNVVMTRETDEMLVTDGVSGSKKLQDLKKRLMIASSYTDSVTVSIHCNKFPSESCKGLQVYFSDDEKAEALAKSIQESAVKVLQPDNHRKAKKADSSIYLLSRAKTPSVLIECGFLSNVQECESLKDPEYQRSLSLSILAGITAAYG